MYVATLLQTAVLSTGVAIMHGYSPAQLRVRDAEKQRQCRHDNARLTKSGNARTTHTYRAAN